MSDNKARGFRAWAFKLDHLKPVEVRLFRDFPTFLPFILGSPIPYYPRDRKAEYEKREIPKIDGNIGLCAWGIQIGPFAAR